MKRNVNIFPLLIIDWQSISGSCYKFLFLHNVSILHKGWYCFSMFSFAPEQTSRHQKSRSPIDCHKIYLEKWGITSSYKAFFCEIHFCLFLCHVLTAGAQRMHQLHVSFSCNLLQPTHLPMTTVSCFCSLPPMEVISTWVKLKLLRFSLSSFVKSFEH